MIGNFFKKNVSHGMMFGNLKRLEIVFLRYELYVTRTDSIEDDRVHAT